MLQEHTFAQMTAPGTSVPIAGNGNSMHMFAVVATDINTSVSFSIEGTLDGTNWFVVDDSSDFDPTSAYLITVAGTYKVWCTGLFKYLRINFISEDGGTSATLDVTYLGGRA